MVSSLVICFIFLTDQSDPSDNTIIIGAVIAGCGLLLLILTAVIIKYWRNVRNEKRKKEIQDKYYIEARNVGQLDDSFIDQDNNIDICGMIYFFI